ncbi:MAG: hypothetical protein ACHQ4H_10700 [Ktedonobacterales bacterium]
MWSTWKRRFIAGALGAAMFSFTACGITTGAGAQGEGTPTGTPPGNAVLTPGQVTIVADNSHYTTSGTAILTISNGLIQTIWSADHQTNCTVLTLERQSGASWQPVGPCLSMRVTRMLPFVSNSQTQVKFAGIQGVTTSWPAGTYRARFTYSKSDSIATSGIVTIYSASFTVA